MTLNLLSYVSPKDVEKLVQAIWQPFGQSMVNFENLLEQMLLIRMVNEKMSNKFCIFILEICVTYLVFTPPETSSSGVKSNSRNDPGVRIVYFESTRRGALALIRETSQRVGNSRIRALCGWKFRPKMSLFQGQIFLYSNISK